jgi:hypothetical protein
VTNLHFNAEVAISFICGRTFSNFSSCSDSSPTYQFTEYTAQLQTMDILLKLKDAREQMAQIAMILFGFGLTANRRLEDKENPTIINLCCTLVELDCYYRDLEIVCNRGRLLPEAFSFIRLYEDVVSDLVTKATAMLSCVHDSKAETIAKGEPCCTLCGLLVRLIHVKLRRCTAQLRLRLQASNLRKYFAAGFPNVPPSRFESFLYQGRSRAR